jgi:protein-disulfide isomerase
MSSMRSVILAGALAVGLTACAASAPPPAAPDPAPVAAAVPPAPRELPVGTSLDPAGGPVLQPPVPAAALTAPTVPIAGAPTLGAASAPVTIVEFMDYECPYCQGFAQTDFPALKARHIDTGNVRYVLVNFPLPRHPRARPAAVAAACAEAQGKFWPMHERLLAKDAGPLRDEDFTRHARALALDLDAFGRCRVERADASWLEVDAAAARAAGVSGTPSFLIGRSAGDVARGRLLRGAPTLAEFDRQIEVLLK